MICIHADTVIIYNEDADASCSEPEKEKEEQEESGNEKKED